MAAAPPTRLDTEMAVYEANKRVWLQEHRDQFVVIKAQSVLGFFEEFPRAYEAGVRQFGPDSDFLVKRVLPEEPIFVAFYFVGKQSPQQIAGISDGLAHA